VPKIPFQTLSDLGPYVLGIIRQSPFGYSKVSHPGDIKLRIRMQQSNRFLNGYLFDERLDALFDVVPVIFGFLRKGCSTNPQP